MREQIEQMRLLETLRRLLEIPAVDLPSALVPAADAVAQGLSADKVDAFLYDEARDSLVAVGVSRQPLSDLERRLGLDVLQLSNGGRVAHVFTTGQTFHSGKLDEDRDELRGVREGLRVRSAIGVPLEVAGKRRGVLMIASQQRDQFTQDDIAFAEFVAQCVGNVAHRAELVEDLADAARQQGRRAVAEELVTVLAHDLRNHLAPIQMRVATLQRRAEIEQRTTDAQDCSKVRKGIDRLAGMIGEILDAARLDQGVFQIDLQPVRIGALIEETLANFAMDERATRFEPTVNPDVVIAADPARLRQCLENLIANALKHSPPDAPVTVRLSPVGDTEARCLRIEVEDSGSGIPAELLPRVFERFVIGQGKEAGTGLGLYLAKRIAVLHGGDLRVESQPGSGTRFELTLPCAAGDG